MIKSCKDCICYESCLDFAKMMGDNIIEAVSGRHYQCEYFKDRSRFKELPCQLGDTVYITEPRDIHFRTKSVVKLATVHAITFVRDHWSVEVRVDDGLPHHVPYNWERVNKDGIFLTYEAAEQALKRCRADANL